MLLLLLLDMYVLDVMNPSKSNVWHGPSSMMSNNANSRKKLDHSFTKNKDTKKQQQQQKSNSEKINT